MEPRTRKFRSRIYVEVPVQEVRPGDVVVFVDIGMYTRFVESVTRHNVMVEQPKGFKPPTWRVSRKKLKECWRWHKKMEASDSQPSG